MGKKMKMNVSSVYAGAWLVQAVLSFEMAYSSQKNLIMAYSSQKKRVQTMIITLPKTSKNT
jgi:hypothetical protein